MAYRGFRMVDVLSTPDLFENLEMSVSKLKLSWLEGKTGTFPFNKWTNLPNDQPTKQLTNQSNQWTI